MTEDDLSDVYSSFRAAGLAVENRLSSLDVLVDSYGGSPVAAYRMAQVVRGFADEVCTLVADHAYSAATLLCYASNEIRLAHYAGLSPIDITLVSESTGKPREEVELVSVDNFLEFAKKARRQCEQLFQSLGIKNGTTHVDSDLLVEMVKQVGALQVGRYFRERTLTGHYADELLGSYMFKGIPDARERINQVITKFLFFAPAHEFHVDYHLCSKWGLIVHQMDTAESDLAKAVVSKLDDLAESGTICPRVCSHMRFPFARFYPITP